jgi:chromate transporter
VTSILWAYLFLGLTAYGGPAMIPVVRRHVVERKGWLAEGDFNLGLALCQMLPGATVMQHAAYVGLRLRGAPGALAAYVGFALPAFCFVTGLSVLYVGHRDSILGHKLLAGLQVAVLVLLCRAGWDFARRFSRSPGGLVLLLLAAVLFLLKADPVAIILGTAALGALTLRSSDSPGSADTLGAPAPGTGFLLFSLLACVSGLAGLYLWNRPCLELAVTMFKVDLVAFGAGAFPVMQHEVVDARGWLTPQMFYDGIALGQMTPGPILMTAAFVGYVLSGFTGAAVAAVAVLTPSFFILLIAAPFSQRLLASHMFRRALVGALATLGGLLFAMAASLGMATDWTLGRAALGAVMFTVLELGLAVHWVLLATIAASLLMF